MHSSAHIKLPVLRSLRPFSSRNHYMYINKRIENVFINKSLHLYRCVCVSVHRADGALFDLNWPDRIYHFTMHKVIHAQAKGFYWLGYGARQTFTLEYAKSGTQNAWHSWNVRLSLWRSVHANFYVGQLNWIIKRSHLVPLVFMTDKSGRFERKRKSVHN